MDRKGLRPLGLPNIVVLSSQAELISRGELAWEDDLDRALSDLRNNSWGTWLRKKVKGVLGSEVRRSNLFYHRKTLTTRCFEVTNWVKEVNKVSVIPEAQLIAHMRAAGCSEKEAGLVIAQLQVAETASAHVLTVGLTRVPVLKFRFGQEGNLDVNERDVAFVTANTAKEDLEMHISEVEGRRTEARRMVERLVKERNKESKG